MLEIKAKQILGTIILVGVAAVTLVVAPYTLLDPINIPKLCTLAFFSTIAFFIYFPGLKSLINSPFRATFLVSLLFIFQMMLVTIFSEGTLNGQIYGTNGRNTGVLAYLSLTLLLIGALFIAHSNFLIKFVRMTLAVGLFLIIYGNLQYLHLDPLPFTTLYTANAPVGTLGNPDFQSAFMGIIAVVSITMAMNQKFKTSVRFALLLMVFFSVVVIYETLAKQGYFAFLAGFGVVIMMWFFMTKRKRLGFTTAGIGLASSILVALGLLNTGPFASYLYKSSLAARGYYWQAALNMIIDHPIFGVGMDGYGDWYRIARDENFAAKGFSTVSNSAHNVYLDIAAGGGFPLVTIYCTLVLLVVVSIFRVIKRCDGFDVYFASIVGAWVAYQAQSIVSINQLGLAIWGWVLPGLIIGYEIQTRNQATEQITVPSRKKGKQQKTLSQQLSSAAVIRIFIGLVVAALVAIPPYYAHASYFSALKVYDVHAMQSAAYLQPIDEYRLLHAATIFSRNNLNEKSLEILPDAVRRFPNSYDLWQLWASIPSASPADIARAKAQLKRLDPFNPDF